MRENSLFHLDFSKNQMLYQSNRLIESRYLLSAAEQKVMIAIISRLNPNQDKFLKCIVSVKDLGRFCGFDESNMYRQIESVSRKIMEKTIKFDLPNGDVYVTHWVQSFRYSKATSTITYELDERLQPELLCLKSLYTTENPQLLVLLSSKYAIRLYHLLKQYVKIGERHISPQEFLRYFDLLESKTYQKVGELRRRIIDPSVEEITSKTDLYVETEYLFAGREMKEVVFRIRQRSQEEVIEEVDSYDELVRAMAHYDIMRKSTVALIKEFGENCVKKNLAFAKKNMNGKKNKSGWIITCVKRDLASQQEEVERLKQEEKEYERKKIKERIKAQELEMIFQARKEKEKENNDVRKSPLEKYRNDPKYSHLFSRINS